MTAEGAMATIRLIDLCETFRTPIVSLTDQAGMSIGSVAERLGTIRYGARAITAIYQARVPPGLNSYVRRVFGVGGAGAVNLHIAPTGLVLALRRPGDRYPRKCWPYRGERSRAERCDKCRIASGDRPASPVIWNGSVRPSARRPSISAMQDPRRSARERRALLSRTG